METDTKAKKMVFDFRMDKISWLMIAAIILLFGFVILPAQFGIASDSVNITYYVVFSLLLTFVGIALATIPVVIFCLFIKRIPDIDYAVWVAFAMAVITSIGYLI